MCANLLVGESFFFQKIDGEATYVNGSRWKQIMIDVPEMIVKNRGFLLTLSLRQEPFVSGSQGPPFPPTFKLAVLGIPSKKRVVS